MAGSECQRGAGEGDELPSRVTPGILPQSKLDSARSRVTLQRLLPAVEWCRNVSPALLSFLTEVTTKRIAEPNTARRDYTLPGHSVHARSQKTSQIVATEVRRAFFDTPVTRLVSDNSLLPEPAEDPSRPASAGRPAYDDDRASFEPSRNAEEQEKERDARVREALRLPPKKAERDGGQRYSPFDDGVKGGKSGYGKIVDSILPSEAVFVVGVFAIVVLAVAAVTAGPPPSMLDF
jgi:hypothetical protein